MSDDETPLPPRPELLAIILRVDLKDAYYSKLGALAGRIGVLLADTNVREDPNLLRSLDDLLGAIYAFILARHHCFEDRADRTPELKPVLTRLEEIQRGKVRIDGKWIAGWHFNSGIFRVAAVYHRILKLVLEVPESKEYVPSLEPRVQDQYREWVGAKWSNDNLGKVHTEVNALKHTPRGVHDRRDAGFRHAVWGIEELLNLVETWRKNGTVPPKPAPPNSG